MSNQEISNDEKLVQEVQKKYREMLEEGVDPYEWAYAWRSEINRGGFKAVDFLMREIVDTQKCVGCAACVTICPTDVFDYKDEHPVDTRNDACVFCELCADVCPVLRPLDKDLQTLLGFKPVRSPVILVEESDDLDLNNIDLDLDGDLDNLNLDDLDKKTDALHPPHPFEDMVKIIKFYLKIVVESNIKGNTIPLDEIRAILEQECDRTLTLYKDDEDFSVDEKLIRTQYAAPEQEHMLNSFLQALDQRKSKSRVGKMRRTFEAEMKRLANQDMSKLNSEQRFQRLAGVKQRTLDRAVEIKAVGMSDFFNHEYVAEAPCAVTGVTLADLSNIPDELKKYIPSSNPLPYMDGVTGIAACVKSNGNEAPATWEQDASVIDIHPTPLRFSTGADPRLIAQRLGLNDIDEKSKPNIVIPIITNPANLLKSDKPKECPMLDAVRNMYVDHLGTSVVCPNFEFGPYMGAINHLLDKKMTIVVTSMVGDLLHTVKNYVDVYGRFGKQAEALRGNLTEFSTPLKKAFPALAGLAADEVAPAFTKILLVLINRKKLKVTFEDGKVDLGDFPTEEVERLKTMLEILGITIDVEISHLVKTNHYGLPTTTSAVEIQEVIDAELQEKAERAARIQQWKDRVARLLAADWKDLSLPDIAAKICVDRKRGTLLKQDWKIAKLYFENHSIHGYRGEEPAAINYEAPTEISTKKWNKIQRRFADNAEAQAILAKITKADYHQYGRVGLNRHEYGNKNPYKFQCGCGDSTCPNIIAGYPPNPKAITNNWKYL